jgi:hypothetical protein
MSRFRKCLAFLVFSEKRLLLYLEAALQRSLSKREATRENDDAEEA